MIGLIVLFAFAVYLWLSTLVVWLAVRWAKRTGRSAKRWGIAAGLFMYLLVFWDHIPTLVLHKYYCATKAGFWVYKTPEQWKAENPGVAETLTWRESSPLYEVDGFVRGNRLNERFIWVNNAEQNTILPVRLIHESIVDLNNNETVVERIKVGSGYGSLALGGDDWRVLKFWVKMSSCIPNESEFVHYRVIFKQLGREVK